MGDKTFLFVGCVNREAPYFQGARGKGIALFEFDLGSGKGRPVSETTGIENPTYLSFDSRHSCVYANSEVLGWNEGTVSAYRFNPEKASLTYLNKQATLGSITAHNSFDRDHRFLLVANYSIGPVEDLPGKAVSVFPISDDGSLGPVSGHIAHQGTGVDPARQERPHAHSVLASPDNRFAIVADLGIDQLLCHELSKDGALKPATAKTSLPPGSGPRHFVFHPTASFIFVINELNSTISSLSFEPKSGKMQMVETVPAVPEAAREHNHCADLHIGPDGRFLYGSNRGHDSIVIHAVDATTGRLTLVGHQPSGGATPRNFAIDPSGNLLLAANQNSDSIVVFRIDREKGTLHDTGARLEAGTPVCIKFHTTA